MARWRPPSRFDTPTAATSGGSMGMTGTANTAFPATAAVKPGLDSLGYDPEYDAVVRRLNNELATELSQVDEDTSTVKADIGVRRRGLQQQHPTDLKNILENFAGRGMAYSGRYVDENANNENQYANQLSGLDTEQTGRLSAIDRALTKFKQGQANTLSDAQGARAAREAAKAEKDAADALAIEQAQSAQQAKQQEWINPATGELGVGSALNISPGTGTPSLMPNGQSWEQFVESAPNDYILKGTDQPIYGISQPTSPRPFNDGQPIDSPATTEISTAPVARTTAPVVKPAAHAAESVGSNVRGLNTFSGSAQSALKSGGIVVGGNGYSYKMVNGQVVRVK